MMKDKEQKALSSWKRTQYCGALRPEHVGQEVVLAGWVQRVRDMGHLVFVDLRDREGLVQAVFSTEKQELQSEAKKLKPESAVGLKGVVRKRAEKAVNPQLSTGAVEVEASALKVYNPSKVPPFVVADPVQASEELRFKYRYLDLRRPSLQRGLRLRHEAALRVRNFLSANGFLEIETPFLTKSTPEGARDYLVPSRIFKGRFFALPQSPQIFKQILMVSGFDRYFQIVRCFRDEDLRADRQPEFTQVDIEMSFSDRPDIFEIIERLMEEVYGLIGVKPGRPFPRFTWRESMDKFGTDKPDLRIPGEITDLTPLAPGLESTLIQKTLAGGGGALEGLIVPGGGKLSRSQIEKLELKAKESGLPGLAWIKKTEGLKSSLKIPEAGLEKVWEACRASTEDLILLAAGERSVCLRALGEVRIAAAPVEILSGKDFRFAWVTDFPLFEWSEEENRLVSMHHPFTSPHDEDLDFLEQDPKKVLAKAYDIVLNGTEIGGGSTRIHDLKLQRRIFRVLGLSDEEAEARFGFFLESLDYGAPPHGGIALGFDRMVMFLAGEKSIREVIPFPKTTSTLCLLTGSPSAVNPKQLCELGLKPSD